MLFKGRVKARVNVSGQFEVATRNSRIAGSQHLRSHTVHFFSGSGQEWTACPGTIKIADAPLGCARLVRPLTRNARRLSSVDLGRVAIFNSAPDVYDQTVLRMPFVARISCRGKETSSS